MISHSSKLLLIFAPFIVFSIQVNYKKVIHNYDPEAKCLDGSPGLLYVHEGGDKNKILIFLQGGGLCGEETLEKTLESCYGRTSNIMGSSKYWPDEFPADGVQGYLSPDPSVSSFATWTKFIFGYCDGSLHQGYARDPIKYKGIDLYFRGSAITRSHFDWINSKYNLKGASKIVLTGGSAGAVGVNLWNNYLKQYVGDAEKVFSIPDSGVFLNFKTHRGDDKIQKQISNIYKVANTEESTPLTECNQFHKGEQWKCLFIENSYQFIKGKFMVVNSEYDAWSVFNILGENCLKLGLSGYTLSHCSKTQMTQIEKYRSFYREMMAKFLVLNNQLSIWSIACSNHVYACLTLFYDSPLEKIPTTIGKTVKQAIDEFVHEDKRIVIFDQNGWPSNLGCAK